ncbi:peptidase S8/S53 domain-containing protein [Immersiella caudata]|uniref:Peptidase S8/S53 domain-containing protein n=1 Tax=Immersiella caudata TaxID=314043 RepID=A0AA39X5E2_9PEZI|nr:peptidase S8/S53 domain-containing protein [Immersiella caudata]
METAISSLLSVLRGLSWPAGASANERTAATLASSAALIGERVASVGDANSKVRGASIPLSARLCAAAKCLRDGETVATLATGVQTLNEELLHELERIVTWPKRSKQFTARPVEELVELLDATPSVPKDKLDETVLKFLTEAQSSLRENLVEICDRIIASAPPEPPTDEIQSESEVCIPQHVVDKILTAVLKCSVCSSASCLQGSARNRDKPQHHPTWLYLGRPKQSGDAPALFDVLVSSHSYLYWQEIGLGAGSKKCESAGSSRNPKRKRVRFSEPAQPSFSIGISTPARREVSEFCGILARQSCARIFLELEDQHLVETDEEETFHHDILEGEGISLARILHDYDLSVAERIRLAHTIARAFWQLYNTNLTSTRWTDHNIWFSLGRADVVSGNAYIALPFRGEEAQLGEYIQGGLIHKCPRIFALGVLLLEIGLAQPIQCRHPEPSDQHFFGKTNRDYAEATGLLKSLEEGTWAGYCSKRLFDRAVKDCLNGQNFSSCHHRDGDNDSITERRRILYEKVVEPLGLLAGSFHPERPAGIKKKGRTTTDVRLVEKLSSTRLEVKELPLYTLGSFHAGRAANPDEWLEDLRVISRYVYDCTEKARREGRALTPVRVAILDSGCNLQVEYFQEEPQRVSRITDRRDFVEQSFSDKEELEAVTGSEINDEPPASTLMKDTFGHGTLMAMLLVETAPTAELIIGRVAENTTELEGKEHAISEAIRWAGIDRKADIISMSFGVCDADGHISDAILDVRKSRKDKVIFLASAGNSGPHQGITFPACRDDVLSIRMADHLGAVAASNPPTEWRGHVSFATFGANIPSRLLERHHEPEVCKPGSSVSTAVAAGIAATMLSYTALLPLLFPNLDKTKLLLNLGTPQGARALFELLSDDMGNRMRFINPVKFITDRGDNMLRLCALIDCARKAGSERIVGLQ